MSPRSHNRSSPVLHRAFCFALVAWALPTVWGQAPGYRPAPNYITNGQADQAEGARLLKEFQGAGIAGDYWLGFELRVMPRQGAERTVAGEIFGTRNDRGPLTRIIFPGSANTKSWLMQGGPEPSLWVSDSSSRTSAARSVTGDGLMEPIDGNPGTDITPFDLQMPFRYWTDFIYEGLTRVRGRPAHSFVLYPPASFTAASRGLAGVRILVDSQFQALVQAELLGTNKSAEKTITILDLKKLGEHWIPKEIDFRNNLTRGKTRFTVTAAGLDLALAGDVFEPGRLGSPPPPVPADKIQHL